MRLTLHEEFLLMNFIYHPQKDRLSAYINQPISVINKTLSRLRQKLRVSNDVELVAKAIQAGLISMNNKPMKSWDISDMLPVLELPIKQFGRFNMESSKKYLETTKYYLEYVSMDEFLIERTLYWNPEFLHVWDQWQRLPHNLDHWFLLQVNPKLFHVGLEYKEEKWGVYEYSCVFKAYAVYIKRELERIRCL